MRRQGILSKSSLEPPRRAPERAGWGFWALGAACIYLAMPIGAQVALTISGDLDALQPEAMTLRANAIAMLGWTGAALVVALALLIVLNRKAKDAGREAGFTPRWTDALWGLACFIAALPVLLLVTNVATLLDRLVTGSAPDPLAHETLRLMSDSPGTLWWWLTTLSVVIGAPVVEEVLYRGFLQSAFAAALRSRWVAILLTSVIFTAVHVSAADARALPGIFALAVAMGIAFERKGRIGVPIVMHALYNAFNVVISI